MSEPWQWTKGWLMDLRAAIDLALELINKKPKDTEAIAQAVKRVNAMSKS